MFQKRDSVASSQPFPLPFVLTPIFLSACLRPATDLLNPDVAQPV